MHGCTDASRGMGLNQKSDFIFRLDTLVDPRDTVIVREVHSHPVAKDEVVVSISTRYLDILWGI